MRISPEIDRVSRPNNNDTAAAPARVCIETYGCAYNQSDSEVMAGLLERGGCEIVDSAADADAVIVNSCTVKDRTYRELLKRLRALSAPPADGDRSPVVILAGCAPRILGQSRELARFAQLGPDALGAIVEVVESAIAGKRVTRLERAGESRLSLPHRRRNPAIEIVPISKGCLGACAFCQTVIARGRLHSHPLEQILDTIRLAVDEGARMIWLTAQDCGAWGMDTRTCLPRLLESVAALPGDFLVRLGMANPDHVKLFLDDVACALSHPRFFRFAHIPVQSGSDDVLRAMGRRHTADDFLRIVQALRQRAGDITIATDIITGFPGETDEDFERTLDLLRETEPPIINRSRFSPRPGTRAARLEPVHSQLAAERSLRAARLHHEIIAADSRGWTGWQGAAITENILKQDTALTRNQSYKPIVVQRGLRPGQKIAVRITGAEGFHLLGEVLDQAMPS
ncbi:MAG: tRNA (N(6)-L-threonylcarbamoyladenosine(37)-C(2))-methylthiotransferase [Candidatus Sumerlaeota bacterium]|nr:tRNA (N(6)-L-threonylcarbamoyladenosine(37)-C(2))-methylthiotransferase [Candidatus Sumerlaeota bacterium]